MEYNAKSIERLTFREGCRKRIGIYLGSADRTGVLAGLLELVNNATDEALVCPTAKSIELVIGPDWASCRDYGRGMPHGPNDFSNEVMIDLLTENHSGAKFDDNAYGGKSRGLNGTGSAATCCSSDIFKITSYRDGAQWYMEFEKGILSEGEPQRNMGLLFILLAVVFLGIALFSSLIHIKNNKIIWLLGAVVLFAGFYVTYSAYGVSFWSDSIVSNTTVLGAAMMFYMFFLSILIVSLLNATKRMGTLVILVLLVANAIFFVLPVVSEVRFYDTLPCWIVAQLLVNITLTGCLIKEIITSNAHAKWLYAGALLPLIAFFVDAVGTWQGAWQGGLVSQCVFVVLFAMAMIMVLKFIPQNINAATKARELELEKTVLNAQLAESRISTMMSQIRPHFIYNTLGSIEQLCKLDPPKAGELVHNFAKYLRGNFGELDNPKPIFMSQEMQHVHYYISIENVRFPDMTFTFEMNSEDFKIPALTVQPLVENAIKHGLMKLTSGGTIHVVSYETDKSYCISVVDDGVGFDVGALHEDRTHVGIRNIRERLKVMVNGKLEIESTVGVGTKVLITIPKEVQK